MQSDHSKMVSRKYKY